MCLAQTEPAVDIPNNSLRDLAQRLGEKVSKRFVPTPTDKQIRMHLLQGLKRLKETLR